MPTSTARIRTLVLTFLYRTMPELFERGHVHIAVPPLYHVKLGSRGMYFEKDAQLEDLLVRERVKDMTVTARDDQETALTEARWVGLVRDLGHLEAWTAKLEAEYGPAARFAISHGLIEAEAGDPPDAAALIASIPPNGYELAVEGELDDVLHVRVVETETSTAQPSHSRSPCSARRHTDRFRGRTRRLGEVVGLHPSPCRSARSLHAPRRSTSFALTRSTWRRRACRSAGSRDWER